MSDRLKRKVPISNPRYFTGLFCCFFGMILLAEKDAASYAIVFLVILVIVTMIGITLMAIADYQVNRGHPANRNPLLWIGVANLAFFGIGPKPLLITLIMGGVGFAFYEIALRQC